MKICYFGIFDHDFSRNGVYIKGLEESGVDIIECRDNSPGLLKYWRLWRKHAALKGDYDAMIVGYPGHIVVPLAKILSKKIVVADLLGSLYDAEKHSHIPGKIRLLKARIIDWMAVHFADLLLLESEAQKKYFEEVFGVSHKYAVVYTGADEGIYGAKEIYSPKDKFIALFRGKLTPESGIVHILNAAEILKGNNYISFKIIGRGYLLDLVQRMIKEKNLYNVELISDFIPDQEMRTAILGSSLYLGQFGNNQRLERTIPHKAFEALAAGIPYLSGDAPAIREVIKEGETGFFIHSADPKKMVEKIELLSKSPDLMLKVSENMKKLYQAEFSSMKLAGRIIDILRSKSS